MPTRAQNENNSPYANCMGPTKLCRLMRVTGFNTTSPLSVRWTYSLNVYNLFKNKQSRAHICKNYKRDGLLINMRIKYLSSHAERSIIAGQKGRTILDIHGPQKSDVWLCAKEESASPVWLPIPAMIEFLGHSNIKLGIQRIQVVMVKAKYGRQTYRQTMAP